MGGIGKTALSQRLERWVTDALPLTGDWGPPPPTTVQATVRLDLHGSAGQIDIVSTLLALRRGAAQIHPRWPRCRVCLRINRRSSSIVGRPRSRSPPLTHRGFCFHRCLSRPCCSYETKLGTAETSKFDSMRLSQKRDSSSRVAKRASRPRRSDPSRKPPGQVLGDRRQVP
jgi:hypothetical protein